MTNLIYRKRFKDWWDDNQDKYFEDRDEDFNNEFLDFYAGLGKELITEDLVQGFLDSYSYKTEDEWANDEYESEVSGIEDRQMEEAKDRAMGI